MTAVTTFVADLCDLPLAILAPLVALAAIGLSGFAIYAALFLTKSGWATRLAGRIWRHQKWLWAALYLGCIPGFAYPYSRMDHAFYEPNLTVEQAYSADEKSLAAAICSAINRLKGPAIIRDRKTPYDPFRLPTRGSDPELEFIDLHQFECVFPLSREVVSSSGVHFDRLHMLVEPIEDMTVVPVENDGKMLTLHEMQRIVDAPSHPGDYTFAIYLFTSALFLTDDTPLPQTGKARSRKQSAGDLTPPVVLVMLLQDPDNPEDPENLKLLQAAEKYGNGSTGFTSDVSDNFQRMLYFSATTITTLGYGDIVPISPQARGLVTVEAVVGVVLIGLFLNSLFRR